MLRLTHRLDGYLQPWRLCFAAKTDLQDGTTL